MAGRGLNITVDGLMELGADLRRLERPGLSKAIRESLKSEGGQALVSEMKAIAPRRTGGMVSRIAIHHLGGGDDVLVGYKGDGVYPQELGTWIESGTQKHMIKAKKGKYLAIGAKNLKQVEVSGIRAHNVARKAMRRAEWEVLADIVDKINMMIGGMGE